MYTYSTIDFIRPFQPYTHTRRVTWTHLHILPVLYVIYAIQSPTFTTPCASDHLHPKPRRPHPGPMIEPRPFPAHDTNLSCTLTLGYNIGLVLYAPTSAPLNTKNLSFPSCRTTNFTLPFPPYTAHYPPPRLQCPPSPRHDPFRLRLWRLLFCLLDIRYVYFHFQVSPHFGSCVPTYILPGHPGNWVYISTLTRYLTCYMLHVCGCVDVCTRDQVTNVLCHATYRSREDSGLPRRCLRISRGLSRGLAVPWDGSRYVSCAPRAKLKLEPELNI
jgi:hypothetical protein